MVVVGLWAAVEPADERWAFLESLLTMPCATQYYEFADVIGTLRTYHSNQPHAHYRRQAVSWLVRRVTCSWEQSHQMPATQNSMLLCYNWGSTRGTCNLSGHHALRLLLKNDRADLLGHKSDCCPPRDTFQASRRMLVFWLSQQMPV